MKKLITLLLSLISIFAPAQLSAMWEFYEPKYINHDDETTYISLYSNQSEYPFTIANEDALDNASTFARNNCIINITDYLLTNGHLINEWDKCNPTIEAKRKFIEENIVCYLPTPTSPHVYKSNMFFYYTISLLNTLNQQNATYQPVIEHTIEWCIDGKNISYELLLPFFNLINPWLYKYGPQLTERSWSISILKPQLATNYVLTHKFIFLSKVIYLPNKLQAINPPREKSRVSITITSPSSVRGEENPLPESLITDLARGFDALNLNKSPFKISENSAFTERSPLVATSSGSTKTDETMLLGETPAFAAAVDDAEEIEDVAAAEEGKELGKRHEKPEETKPQPKKSKSKKNRNRRKRKQSGRNVLQPNA